MMKSLKLSFKEPEAKSLTTFFATTYLLSILVIYPFYMRDGYVNISYHKYVFFLYSSIGAVLLLFLTGVGHLIKSFKHIFMVDIFVLIYAIVTTISYIFSDFREHAFLGEDTWYMGFLTIMLLIAVFIFISKLWNYQEFIIPFSLFAAMIVYLLAILDRFSIYFIPIEVRHSSFISTMGNINWLMGYYSVMTPIGIGLFIKEIEKKEITNETRFYFLFSFISFMVGFAQGSESVFLFDLALFLCLFYFSYREWIKIESVFAIIGLWGVSAQIIRILRLLFPKGYNYSKDGLCSKLTANSITILIAVISFILAYIFYRNSDQKLLLKMKRILYKIIPIGLFILIISWLVIGLIKTNTNHFQKISSNLFLFDEHFGSDRGKAYETAFMCLKEMNFKQLLIGVGPDSFGEFAYSVPKIRFELRAFWPKDYLTNAHIELLTMLINEGILGVASYLGIFISFIIFSFKRSDSILVRCIGMSAICYLVHNIISFGQILSTPFMFIIMALAVSYSSNEKS